VRLFASSRELVTIRLYLVTIRLYLVTIRLYQIILDYVSSLLFYDLICGRVSRLYLVSKDKTV